jgi:L-ascorbate metabolism protein UlaG (beta-lactamase superfamily)
MDAKTIVSRLHWLGHDGFRLDGPPVVYFDPWKLHGNLPVADLVLISHEHHDHCSPDDIDQVRGPKTVVVASVGAAAKLPGALIARPGEVLLAAGLRVEAVPA